MSKDQKLNTFLEGFDNILEGSASANHIVIHHNAFKNNISATQITHKQPKKSLFRHIEKMRLVFNIKVQLKISDTMERRLKKGQICYMAKTDFVGWMFDLIIIPTSGKP